MNLFLLTAGGSRQGEPWLLCHPRNATTQSDTDAHTAIQLKDMKGSSDVSHVLELIPPICLLKYHQHNIHDWGNNLMHGLLCATEAI